METIAPNAALIIIDIQYGFDSPMWGPSTNPECEANAETLADAWSKSGRPVVVVRHNSPTEGSPLAPGSDGNNLKDFVAKIDPALSITKTVNSAFYGTPNLQEWLTTQGISQFVVGGIQTNMCVETTARMGGNLGYDVVVPIDATRTFDLKGPDGSVVSADELMRTTATNLHAGGFAKVTTTARLLDAVNGATAR